MSFLREPGAGHSVRNGHYGGAFLRDDGSSKACRHADFTMLKCLRGLLEPTLIVISRGGREWWICAARIARFLRDGDGKSGQ